MSMHVLPTAPSPTVTHLMNLDALAAIEGKTPQEEMNKEASLNLEGGNSGILAFVKLCFCFLGLYLVAVGEEEQV